MVMYTSPYKDIEGSEVVKEVHVPTFECLPLCWRRVGKVVKMDRWCMGLPYHPTPFYCTVRSSIKDFLVSLWVIMCILVVNFRLAAAQAQQKGRPGTRDCPAAPTHMGKHQQQPPGAKVPSSLFFFGEKNIVRRYTRFIIEWPYPFTTLILMPIRLIYRNDRQQ